VEGHGGTRAVSGADEAMKHGRPVPMRIAGYVRVSSEEQVRSGAGLAAQIAAIRAEATRRHWEVVDVFRDEGLSGRRLDGRLGLLEALRVVEAGEADALVVAKLDRLSRSLIDFAGLVERSRRRGWALVALDLGVDTTTPAGELVATVMSAVSVWERRAIGQRTREALAVRREQGVRLGRPRAIPPDVRDAILDLRHRGLSYQAIADWLIHEKVATAHGGTWRAATVRKVVRAGT
jgi:DNA invertase Pin-like site-specific DNA recombinase